MLNGFTVFQTFHNRMLTDIEISLHDINKAIEANDLKEQPLEDIVSKQYNEFLGFVQYSFGRLTSPTSSRH
jgi:hypothetical protein